MDTLPLLTTGIIALKTADGNIFRKLEEIVRIEADGKYSYIFTLNRDKPEKVIGCISEIEVKLKDSTVFLKCHRSHMINLVHIKKYIRKTSRLVTERGEVPLSDSFAKDFEDRFCK